MILQTAVEDQGTYRAEVRSGAGLVSVEAQLSFNHPDSCHRGCLNGGQCVQQSLCSCPEGYLGRQCEERTETGEGVCVVCVCVCVCVCVGGVGRVL